MRQMEAGMMVDYYYEGVVLTGEFQHFDTDGCLVIEADEGRLHYVAPGAVERIDV